MCLSIPAQVERVTDADNQMVLVNLSGVQREINVACVIDEHTGIETLPGKWVLVHVGFALNLIDEDEARKTLDLLDQIGELSATAEELNQAQQQ